VEQRKYIILIDKVNNQFVDKLKNVINNLFVR